MGRVYEEFEPGQTWTTQARTVTEADVVMFCGISGDYNPLHTDEEHCRDTRFGTRIAHGPLGMSMAIGLMSQLNLINGTALALLNLNWDFCGPIRFGDTVHARVTTHSTRRTKAGDGIVTLHFAVLNQKDETVQEGTAAMLVQTGAAAA
ncbi:MaoC/PaaZ C-terminal domain-containing protein [Afifella pfennigii]|uniref:MaoC/PaaZ C-terminal domain-containing protein n=1 Tax=Afifella pfennigii TaxID=209897 RepID=UPI00047DA7C5|nr:MaoC/PaaZ C-terminal domain-containing protein [Afifella pfennigii]